MSASQVMRVHNTMDQGALSDLSPGVCRHYEEANKQVLARLDATSDDLRSVTVLVLGGGGLS